MINKDQLIGLMFGLLGGASLAIVVLTLSQRIMPAPIVIEPPPPTATVAPSATPGPIRVFISGAVAEQKVVELPPHAILEDGLGAVGGLAKDADERLVNLAQPLADGMQIYIPALGEKIERPLPLVVNTGIEGDPAGDRLVNINTATVDELDALPGIGPSTAEKIVTFREENGAFLVKEDLLLVSGIGEAKFAQVADLITVDE